VINNWIRYEDIEENRNGYYVNYKPVFTGQEFAILIVNIYEKSLFEEAKEICESELNIWIERFPTPLMVMVKNMTDSDFSIKNVIGENYLLGYPDCEGVYFCWGNYPKGKEPDIDLSMDSLSEIYSTIPYRSSDDAKNEIDLAVKGIKALRIKLILWLCVIPAIIAYLGWSNPVVSFLALMYSLFMASKKALELWGVKNKSVKQIEEEKEDQLKEHHHYHCKLNPEGFQKLKLENLKKESTERNNSKIESMRN